jgi:hypothetical protein
MSVSPAFKVTTFAPTGATAERFDMCATLRYQGQYTKDEKKEGGHAHRAVMYHFSSCHRKDSTCTCGVHVVAVQDIAERGYPKLFNNLVNRCCARTHSLLFCAHTVFITTSICVSYVRRRRSWHHFKQSSRRLAYMSQYPTNKLLHTTLVRHGGFLSLSLDVEYARSPHLQMAVTALPKSSRRSSDAAAMEK